MRKRKKTNFLRKFYLLELNFGGIIIWRDLVGVMLDKLGNLLRAFINLHVTRSSLIGHLDNSVYSSPEGFFVKRGFFPPRFWERVTRDEDSLGVEVDRGSFAFNEELVLVHDSEHEVVGHPTVEVIKDDVAGSIVLGEPLVVGVVSLLPVGCGRGDIAVVGLASSWGTINEGDISFGASRGCWLEVLDGFLESSWITYRKSKVV